MKQKEVWDNISEKWSEYRKTPVKEVEEFLKNKKGKVLDLACGSGRNIIPSKKIEYYGVDFSSEMLKLAEKNSIKKNIKAMFFRVDIGKEELPFEKNFFDSVIFISSLHCIEKKKDRMYALEELYRTLKKGGTALITVWNRDSNDLLEENKVKEGFVNWKKEGKNYQRYYYFYEKEELEKLLIETGFKIIETSEPKLEGIRSYHAKKNIIFLVKK